MGTIIPTGFGQARVKVAFHNAADEFVITWGYDGDVAEDPQADADEIHAILVASGKPFLPANYSSEFDYRGVDVTRQTATGPISGTHTANVIGTASLATVPINTAFLLQKHTARGGRMGRGRCFLPGMWIGDNNVNSAGQITAFDLGQLQTLWSAALTALLASDCPPVLLHADGSTPDPITSWTVNGLCATQRRRMRR